MDCRPITLILMYMSNNMFSYFILLACLLVSGPVFAEKSSEIPGPSDFKPVTMSELVSNPDRYNKERVKLVGEVTEVKYTESGKGEPFTLFKLKDENDNEVRVYYEDEHLPLSPGDEVRIMGRYKKEKSYLLYKIKNVIKARYVVKLGDS